MSSRPKRSINSRRLRARRLGRPAAGARRAQPLDLAHVVRGQHDRGNATGAVMLCIFAQAQVTFPVNGVTDPRTKCYAFTNATIVKDGQTTLNKATLVIRDGRITGVGVNAPIPKDAVAINCSGKYIYPSLIDIYTDYGIPQPQRPTPAAGGFLHRSNLQPSRKEPMAGTRQLRVK